MRGTCSAGIRTEGDAGLAEQVFPDSYDKIHSQTMTPVAHLSWASVWARNRRRRRQAHSAIRSRRRLSARSRLDSYSPPVLGTSLPRQNYR